MRSMNGNLSEYREDKPKYVLRIIWFVINITLFRLLIGRRLRLVRNPLLRLFGAKIPNRVQIYPSCKLFAPWNLEVGEYTTIGPNTIIYNKAKVVIGPNSVISQGCFLCTASHDIGSSRLTLVSRDIKIGEWCWVAADAFVCPGVTIGDGSVVGARSVVTKDVKPWAVVAGNPAKFIKKREIKA